MEQRKIEDILNKYVIEAPSMGRSVILADRIDEVAENVHQQLLQQTDCYTALEFLEQMLSKEQKDFGEYYFITDEVREKMSNIKNIQSVIQLIKERQANTV